MWNAKKTNSIQRILTHFCNKISNLYIFAGFYLIKSVSNTLYMYIIQRKVSPSPQKIRRKFKRRNFKFAYPAHFNNSHNSILTEYRLKLQCSLKKHPYIKFRKFFLVENMSLPVKVKRNLLLKMLHEQNKYWTCGDNYH